MTTSTLLPAGWKLETPGPGGLHPGVARLCKGKLTVQIRPASQVNEAGDENSSRVIAWPGYPTSDDWILTALCAGRPIPVPPDIEQWAEQEILQGAGTRPDPA